MKKTIFLIAAMMAGSYANALTLKSGTINGKTNLNPSVSCQLQVYIETNGWLNAVVIIDGEQQYGFTVTSQTADALKNQSNFNEVQIAGRLLRSGDRALFISATDNELTSITYKGLSERSGQAYAVQCLF